MKMLGWLLAAAVLVLGAVAPAGAVEQVGRAAAPDWVEAIEPALPARAPVAGPSTAYLLVDTQVRVQPDGARQRYVHHAIQANDSAGVASSANVDIDFDPSYQRLTLHRLRVHRDGRVQDRLGDARIRVLQRERELEALIYDGSRSASIFLDDVRVGDVVEYAYSLDGSNPVFGGRHAGVMQLQWGVPVAQLRTRLLWPDGRPLTLKTLPTERAVARRRLGAYTEYRLDADAVPARRIDSEAPGWHQPRATLSWSEWQSWSEVVRWALPLYATPASLPPPLAAVRDRILSEHPERADRAAAALRWAQREIRYLGIEVGANSHAPTSPAEVAARRFGDCKDKTLLTVSLMRALGLQAEPALVNTELRRALQGGLPAPAAFNHVIVHLRLDGKSYWLDPTKSPQPGRLDDISQPGWDVALLVAPGSKGLTPMTPGAAQSAFRGVHLLLDSSKGLDAPMTLTVTTQLRGRTAESVRDDIAADGVDRVQQRYLNFYARSYAGLRVAAPMEVQDDPPRNRLRIVEHYVADKLLPFDADKSLREAWLRAPEVLSQLGYPRERLRSDPLALEHPVELKHELELRLPEVWRFTASEDEVVNPAFTLRREVVPVILGGETRGVRLVDHYLSLADHVDADATATYLRDIGKARAALNYRITKGSAAKPLPGRSAFNVPIALLGLFMLAAWIRLARRLHRWDPAPAAGAPAPPRPLGGPLYLLPPLLLAGLCYALVALMLKSTTAYEAHRWAELTLPGGGLYHPMFSLWLMLGLAVITAWFAGIGLSLWLTWQQRSSAPRVFLALAWSMLIWAQLDAWVMGWLLQQVDLERPSGPGWLPPLAMLPVTAYLAGSRRARDTFANRYQATVPASDLATAVPG